ncbi:MAG: hypothetical protein QNJ26_03835 [Desulfobacterales bacterium]|nr:hypothetical protein [Desulfobacterales bacterium]
MTDRAHHFPFLPSVLCRLTLTPACRGVARQGEDGTPETKCITLNAL